MLKTFKYRLNPNRTQRLALQRTLDTCREIWNMALEQRKYQRTHWTVQCRELTELKAGFPEYKQVHVHVLQNVVKKLQRSFERMWELGSGFPRFKNAKRYRSFQFNNTGFSLAGRYLQLSKIGNVKVRLSREIPKGVIKSLTVKQTVSGWYACFSVDVSTQPLPESDLAIGIDVGIENFAALSDGTMIPNPRHYECGQAELRRAQRRVARRKKGGNRRRKAVVLLQKIHERIDLRHYAKNRDSLLERRRLWNANNKEKRHAHYIVLPPRLSSGPIPPGLSSPSTNHCGNGSGGKE